MTKLLTFIGVLNVLIFAIGSLICNISRTARKVRTELKHWRTPSKRCGTNPKTKNSSRKTSR
jgi:hypothetical protein